MAGDRPVEREAHDHEKVVFAISNSMAVPTVILGVSDDAWLFMRSGLTHTFDLTKLGIPFQIVMFGGRDQESIKKMLNVGPDTVDLGKQDIGLPKPPRK